VDYRKAIEEEKIVIAERIELKLVKLQDNKEDIYREINDLKRQI
jgi:hypothetical protein